MTGSGGIGYSPQRSVERALAAARCEDCVVIAEETSSANLRWAGNTLTTNGVSQSRRLTVIAVRRKGDEAAAGVVSRSGVRDDQSRRSCGRRSKRRSRAHRPKMPGRCSNRAAGRCSGPTGAGTTRSAGPSSGCSMTSPRPSGTRSRRPPAATRSCTAMPSTTCPACFWARRAGCGFAMTSRPARWSSTPSPRIAHSAWAGAGSRDFTDVDVTAMDTGLARRLEWARRRVKLPSRAGTRRCCLLAPWPTCSPTCTGRPGPRTRSTGGRCSASPAAAPGWASSWPACP